MGIARKLREQAKSSLHSLFVFGQRLGWDVLPRHFYSSVPDIRELEGAEEWRRPMSMTGVAGAEIEPQLASLRNCCTPQLQERLKKGDIYEHACKENGAVGYGPAEADFLYCYIATKRPPKIVQVGCGVSTAVILLAAKEAGYTPQIVCIDPYPTEYLVRLAGAGLIELIRKPAQVVEESVFSGLKAGEMLFVDSSHAVRPGSEVNRIILEVLPRLPAGCLVHFHDITFPYDYQTAVLSTLFFSHESTLLHAFLAGNQRYRIDVSLSMLHHGCAAEMQSVLPNYKPAVMRQGLRLSRELGGHFPSATYLSVK